MHGCHTVVVHVVCLSGVVSCALTPSTSGLMLPSGVTVYATCWLYIRSTSRYFPMPLSSVFLTFDICYVSFARVNPSPPPREASSLFSFCCCYFCELCNRISICILSQQLTVPLPQPPWCGQGTGMCSCVCEKVKENQNKTKKNKTNKKTKSGQAVVVHACNPSIWEAEAGGFLSSRPSWSTE